MRICCGVWPEALNKISPKQMLAFKLALLRQRIVGWGRRGRYQHQAVLGGGIDQSFSRIASFSRECFLGADSKPVWLCLCF